MDATNPGDVVRHLEKQNELLLEAHNKMAHELHTLQLIHVEEEMLMRKFYDLMTNLGLTKTGERIANAANVEDNQANVSPNSESEGQ